VLPSIWQLHNAFHATLLSPYQETSTHGANYSVPAPELIKGELEWEINAILASRHYRHKKELQYLIRWLRYPKSENSWKLAENVYSS